MPMTYDTAYKTITDHLLTQWDALTPSIVGTPAAPELRFAGIEKPGAPGTTFARFVMDPVSSPRNALRNAEHGQRYENNGIIIVQLLYARDVIDGAERLRKLATAVQNIFRDPAFPGCFIFSNIRVNNLTSEPSFLRANVLLEYQFDELT